MLTLSLNRQQLKLCFSLFWALEEKLGQINDDTSANLLSWAEHRHAQINWLQCLSYSSVRLILSLSPPVPVEVDELSEVSHAACHGSLRAGRLLRRSGGCWVMRSLPERLFGVSVQTDSQRHVWSVWAWCLSVQQRVERCRWNDRKRKVENTKRSSVLVCAAFRSCWETGKASGETMRTAARAVDESVSEVHQHVYKTNLKWSLSWDHLTSRWSGLDTMISCLSCSQSNHYFSHDKQTIKFRAMFKTFVLRQSVTAFSGLELSSGRSLQSC